MNSLRIMKSFLLFGAIGFSLVACNNDSKKDMDNAVDEVETAVENAADNVANKAKEIKSDIKSEMEENEYSTSTSAVLNETQVDSKAMFGDCATVKCSEEKILSFIKDNIVLPKNKNTLDNSLEQVLVVVDKNGAIGDVKFVASSNSKGCPTCQQAAVDVVGKMKNWKPAMKDGNPVAVKMTIPVRFKN